MWHDPEDRLQKAIERFEEADVATAWRMLRGLEKKGVESPRIELYLGHCHLEFDRPEAAVRRYRRAARLAPRRGEPWVGLGLALGRLGRLRKACAAFRRAIRLAPDLEEAHCQLVHCHVLLGEMDRAIIASRRVEALDPTCPHVHRHLAVGHFVEGRFADALAAWRRAEARDPDHPEVATGIGRCLANLRRPAEARSAFQRALARDVRDLGARLGLGDLAAEEGRLEEAIEHYRAAVTLDPRDPDVRERLAEALLDAGRPGAALEALAAPERGEPGLSAAGAGGPPASGRGSSAGWGGDADEGPRAGPSVTSPGSEGAAGLDGAEGDEGATDDGTCATSDCGAVAAELDDAHVVSTAALEARALRDLGRRSSGLALLRATVAAAPGRSEAWRVLGEYLLDEGHPRAAIAPLRRARRLDPSTSDAARLLGRALGRAGRRKEAVSVLARAARHHPKDAQLHLDVAAALLARERPLAAERALLRGLSWLPDGADVWAGLAEIAMGAGRVPEARGRLRAALRRDRRHPRALSLLVTWLVGREQWRRAANAGRAAARVVPGRDPAVLGLGLALLRLSRPREAIVPLRRYVLAAPEDGQGYALLAEALEAIGDADGAAAQRRLARAVEAAA